jgi:hypothetical protein
MGTDGRIMARFGRPVINRFVEQRKIEATVDELNKFKSNWRKMNEQNVRKWETRLVELKKELAANGVTCKVVLLMSTSNTLRPVSNVAF